METTSSDIEKALRGLDDVYGQRRALLSTSLPIGAATAGALRRRINDAEINIGTFDPAKVRQTFGEISQNLGNLTRTAVEACLLRNPRPPKPCDPTDCFGFE